MGASFIRWRSIQRQRSSPASGPNICLLDAHLRLRSSLGLLIFCFELYICLSKKQGQHFFWRKRWLHYFSSPQVIFSAFALFWIIFVGRRPKARDKKPSSENNAPVESATSALPTASHAAADLTANDRISSSTQNQINSVNPSALEAVSPEVPSYSPSASNPNSTVSETAPAILPPSPVPRAVSPDVRSPEAPFTPPASVVASPQPTLSPPTLPTAIQVCELCW